MERKIAGDLFQSAPLTDVRGDSLPDHEIDAATKFQSAPLTDVRGDARSVSKSAKSLKVSIRSPH